MNREKNIKRMILLCVLAFGTTSMYSLPYIKAAFYEPMKTTLHLSNMQIGNLSSIYGIMSMVSYLMGGWIADRFSLKKLITFSLVGSGLVGFYFATFPSYKMLMVVFVLWRFTTLYFSASIKVVRMQGDSIEQGRVFGIYEGISGISGVLISFIGITLLQ